MTHPVVAAQVGEHAFSDEEFKVVRFIAYSLALATRSVRIRGTEARTNRERSKLDQIVDDLETNLFE